MGVVFSRKWAWLLKFRARVKQNPPSGIPRSATEILYEGQEDVHLRRFEEECRMLSQLNHPHIVQFLGIYFDSDDTNAHAPVLVMEFLPMTLAQGLDKYGIMPLLSQMRLAFLSSVT